MDAARAGGLTEQALRERLRAAGLRITQPRLLVLELLLEKPGHYSADEIVDALQVRRTPLPRASVYNVLSAFLTRGLLLMSATGPGRTLYELAETWHHHFVCRVCGAIIDVPCVVGARPCLEPAGSLGEVDEAQVIFRGRCQTCLSTAAALER